MKAIRKEIGQTTDDGRNLVTMALDPNPHHYVNFELPEIMGVCDWINLMAYDYNGPWPGSKTNFNAPLYRADKDPSDPEFHIDAAVKSLLKSGVQSWSLVCPSTAVHLPVFLPAPMVMASINPLQAQVQERFHQSQVASTTYTLTWQKITLVRKTDSPQAVAVWLYSPSQIFISYDSPTIIEKKCSYITNRGLAGAMIWDLSKDQSNTVLASTNNKE